MESTLASVGNSQVRRGIIIRYGLNLEVTLYSAVGDLTCPRLFIWCYRLREWFRSTFWLPQCLQWTKVHGWHIRSPLSPESGGYFAWLILDDDEHGLRMVSESLVHIRFLSGSRRRCLSSGFSIRKKGKIKVPGECFFSMHSSAWVSMLVKTITGLCLVWIYTQTEIEMSLWLSSSFVVNLNIAELYHKDMNLI